MENLNFQKHPSKFLIDLYKEKSYQGANPIDAKVIFIGRDPNWAINIDETPIFNLVREYLTDGVKFWEKYDIHHPFLHKDYKGEGKKYHNSISRLNFSKNIARKISFIEIIGFPTTGMSSVNVNKFNEYLLSPENRNHLIELDRLLNNSEKLFFFYWGLIDCFKFLNKKTGLFKSFINIDKKSMIRTDLNKIDNVYFHKHFSMGISPETLQKISIEVEQNLND